MRSKLIISALSAMTVASDVPAQAWLDLTIGPGGIADGAYDELGGCYALQPVETHINPDGNIIITGEVVPWCNMPQSNQHFFAARFFPDGTVDSTFGEFGIAYANPCTSTDFMQHSELLSDGSVMLAGYEHWPFINDPSNQAVVAKLLPNGMADTTYGMSGIRYMSASPSDLILRGLDVDSEDRVVLFAEGSGGGQGLCRLDEFGAYDTTFHIAFMPLPPAAPDTTFTTFYSTMKLQDDDKILMTGRYGPHPDYVRFIVRFMPDGTLDQTFGTNGYFMNGPFPGTYFESLRVDQQERIVALGGNNVLYASDQRELLRLTPDGTPDPSFGTNGFTVFSELPGNTAFEYIDVLPDDRIVYHVEVKCKLFDGSGVEVSGFGNGGVASVTLPANSRGCIAVEDDGGIVAAFKSIADHQKWVRYFTDISTSAQAMNVASEPTDWLVFPNPFSDGLVVRTQAGNLKGPLRFELMQTDGRLVYSETWGSMVTGDVPLSIPAGLVVGSYLLSITSSQGTTVLPVLRSN